MSNVFNPIFKPAFVSPAVEEPEPPVDFIAFYKMDLLAGSVITDETGNNHGAALASVVLDTGLIDNGLRFVRGATSQGNLVNFGNGNLTYSLFFKTSNISNVVQYIVGDNTAFYLLWNSDLGGLGNKLLFNNQAWGNGLLIGHYIDLNTVLVQNQWYHFAWIYNSSTNQNEVFIDAVSKGTRVGALPATGITTIGNMGATGNGLIGMVDHMKIYDSVLGLADIQELNNERP